MGLYGVKTFERTDHVTNERTDHVTNKRTDHVTNERIDHVASERTECGRDEGEPKVGVVILANRQTSYTRELQSLGHRERAMDGIGRDGELVELMNNIYDNFKCCLGSLNDSDLDDSEW